MSLPHKLKLLRAEHNMTQEELAEQINVARATIAGYETRNRQPSHEKLTALADTFGVSIDYLLDTREEDPAVTLTLDQERSLDQQVFTLYSRLSARSKEDTYEYLRLLELRDKSGQ